MSTKLEALEQLVEKWRKQVNDIDDELERHKELATEKANVIYAHIDELRAEITKLKEATK